MLMPAPSMTTADGAGFIGGDTVKTVFNRTALDAYRAANVFRRVADVKWSREMPPMPGSAVTFTIITALAPAISALAEATEPTPVNIADSQKTVTLVEQGNAVKHTKKLRLTTFLNFDMAVPREVAANMEESMDIVARNVLNGGTNVLYSGDATSTATLDAADVFSGNNARRSRAFLAKNNTPGPGGGSIGGPYIGFIHPDVSYDFMAETGQQAWSAPHVYVDTANIYTGEIGMFAGVRWVENANCPINADAGAGNVDAYSTLVVGEQALGEAVGEAQHMVIAGPFDDLQRFISVGWYGLLGYGRIRENSLLRYESASSIGANA
jgi:N4-gp56 family major capsid protein